MKLSAGAISFGTAGAKAMATAKPTMVIQTPQVTLAPASDPEYFPVGVKHRYARKKAVIHGSYLDPRGKAWPAGSRVTRAAKHLSSIRWARSYGRNGAGCTILLWAENTHGFGQLSKNDFMLSRSTASVWPDEAVGCHDREW